MPAGERRRRQAAAQIRRLKPEYATYYAARARFHRPTLRRKPVGLREAAAVLRCSTATRPYRPRRPSAPVAFPFAFLRLRSEFPALYERSIIGPATRLSPFWMPPSRTSPTQPRNSACRNGALQQGENMPAGHPAIMDVNAAIGGYRRVEPGVEIVR